MPAKLKLIQDLTDVETDGLDAKDDAKAMVNLKKYAKEVATAISKCMTTLVIPPGSMVDATGLGATPNASLLPLTDILGGASTFKKAILQANQGSNPPDAGVKKFSKEFANAIITYAQTCGVGPSQVLIAPLIPPHIGVPTPAPIPVADLTGGALILQKDLLKIEKTGVAYAMAVASAISTYFLSLGLASGTGFISITNPGPPPVPTGIPNVAPISITEG